MKKIYLFLFLLSQTLLANAQVNLVPNPSFEDTVACPTSANQIDKAVGWHASRESPDYFNICDFSLTGTTSIPGNFCGYQNPEDGFAYAGLVAYTTSATNGREFLSCTLNSSMNVGETYSVSVYVSLSGGLVKTIACNKIGFLFSTVNYDLTNNAPISNYSQFYTETIISDTTDWVFLNGTFVCDSNYQYLTIGNFFDDTNTDTLNVASPSTYAYYYIDKLNVSIDTVLSNPIHSKSNGLMVFPNPCLGELSIHSSEERVVAVTIFNQLGVVCFNSNYSFGIGDVELNLALLSAGVYNVQILLQSGNCLNQNLIKN